MLWLPGADGNDAWQDHVSYAVLRDEWPAQPYPPSGDPKVVILVNGAYGAGTARQVPSQATRALARQLAAELGIPLLSRDVIGSGEALWTVLADSPAGGVVEGCFRPDEAQVVMAGLRRCGLDPSRVSEISYSPAEASGSGGPPGARPEAGPGQGLGLGLTEVVDTGQEVGPGDIVRIALQVGGDSRS